LRQDQHTKSPTTGFQHTCISGATQGVIMRRIVLLLITLLFVGALSAPTAMAASPHFKKNGEPACTISGTSGTASVNCTATLAGLGNEDVRVVQTVSGSAVYQCRNQGGNTAPGQNKVLVGPVTTPVIFPASAIKNGNLTVSVTSTLTAPATVTGAEAGCPNANWTGVNPVLTVTSIQFVIEQPVGNPIFSCSATDPFSGTIQLTC